MKKLSLKVRQLGIKCKRSRQHERVLSHKLQHFVQVFFYWVYCNKWQNKLKQYFNTGIVFSHHKQTHDGNVQSCHAVRSNYNNYTGQSLGEFSQSSIPIISEFTHWGLPPRDTNYHQCDWHCGACPLGTQTIISGLTLWGLPPRKLWGLPPRTLWGLPPRKLWGLPPTDTNYH